MTRKTFASVALLAALAALPVSRLIAQDASSAATGTFKIDSVHSSAVYRITHLNTSAHWGIFEEPTGTFTVGADGSFNADVTIELAKLDSGNAKRDEHLRGPDFFNAKQFPQMTFKSTEGKASGNGAFVVKGNLTIKGTSKAIEVTFKKVGEGKGRNGEVIAGYEADFTIDRLEYGVNYMPQGLGKDVRIIIALEGAKQ
jgi:polyisoprenoid-binding protein YceI